MGFFLTLFIFAALFLVGELIRPKPAIEDAKPAGIGDFNFPTATEGRHIPKLWGEVRIKGPNVIWFGDFRQEAIRERVSTGLFSSRRVTVGFRYYVGMQFGLCRGRVGTTLEKVHIGDKLIWEVGVGGTGGAFTINEPEFFGGESLGNGGFVGDFAFYEGSRLQPVSSYLAQFQLEGGDTPAYRGLCYVAPRLGGGTIQGDSAATYVGNSANLKPISFQVRSLVDGPPGFAVANRNVNGNDANPAYVIYDILTDDEGEFRLTDDDIDLVNFEAVATTLKSEGNGFAFLLDNVMESADVIRLIEQQIDGVLFQSQIDGKFKINLARNDYDINTVPEINVDNYVEVRSFTRGSWDATTNEVRIAYNDAVDEFKDTFAIAQDQANVMIQGGNVISSTQRFPGVKNGSLATSIATRELRTLSYPLAKAQIVVDRTFWDVEPADVVAFTDPDFLLDKLPMRVAKISIRELGDNRITLDLVQDVFQFGAGIFSNPPVTGFIPPVDQLVAFPATDIRVFEAPRAFVSRDPFSATTDDKIWAGARPNPPAVVFDIFTRHFSGAPSGTFVDSGEVFDFFRIGELKANLDSGSPGTLSTLDIVADPDSQSALESAFDDDASEEDIGLNLINLIQIGDEFMLVESAANQVDDVRLLMVHRGVLDSAQVDHLAGAPVYLLFLGGGLSEDVFPPGDTVEIKLSPRSLSDSVDLGMISASQVVMSNRIRRPYPPSQFTLNGSLFPTSVSIDGTSGDNDTRGILTQLTRRDFRTSDEIVAAVTDAATLFPDFPTANDTQHEVEVVNDPDSAATSLLTLDFVSAQTATITRTSILAQTDGVLPTTLRFKGRSRHDFESVNYTSRHDLEFDFTVTSTLTGQFNSRS